MKYLLFVFSIIWASNSYAESTPNQKNTLLSSNEIAALVASHTEAFQALNVKLRDPYLMLGPDNYYYLTGTTAGSHWGDTIGIHLWRSSDLAKWDDLGFVWDLYADGKENNSWHFKQTVKHPEYKNPYAIWAPEIHFINGNWYIPHCLNVSGHGLLKSASGKPEGPYEVCDPVGLSGIDSHLFQDDDGSVYYCYQADYIAKIDIDKCAITEEFHKLKHEGNHPVGYEGILLLKFDDKYVHVASGRYGYEPTDSYDLYYTVSKNINGPYGERRKAIVNAGHGNLFKDKQGRWWSTAFDHPFTNQWSLWLVPIEIEITDKDVKFIVLDNRFAVTETDSITVKKLAKEGIPELWKEKAPWWRPILEKN